MSYILRVGLIAKSFDDDGKLVGDMRRVEGMNKYALGVKDGNQVSYYVYVGYDTTEIINDDFGGTISSGGVHTKILACNERRISCLRINKSFIIWWISVGCPEEIDGDELNCIIGFNRNLWQRIKDYVTYLFSEIPENRIRASRRISVIKNKGNKV